MGEELRGTPVLTEAAVLLPVFRDGRNELRLVLVTRSPVGLHGGQVGLPGGRREPDDTSPLETALRETDEEIGLAIDEIEVLAEFEPVDTYTTGIRVYPFLACVRAPRRWRLNTDEVSSVLTPTIRELADPRARNKPMLRFPGWPEPRTVEQVVLGDGHAIWGLTLRLIDGVLPRLLAEEWRV